MPHQLGTISILMIKLGFYSSNLLLIMTELAMITAAVKAARGSTLQHLVPTLAPIVEVACQLPTPNMLVCYSNIFPHFKVTEVIPTDPGCIGEVDICGVCNGDNICSTTGETGIQFTDCE